MNFDFTVLEFLQNIRTEALSAAALFASGICSKLLIIAVFCLLFWCFDKKYAYGLAVSFVFSGLITQGMKIAFAVERPFVRNAAVHPEKRALAGATGYSFPSGHTQTASSLFVYTALKTSGIVRKVLCFLAVFAVMISRLVLGVHTPADVVVSFLVTSAVCFAVYRFPFHEKRKSSLKIAVCGMLGAVALFLFSLFRTKFCGIPFAMAEDSIETAVISFVFFVLYYIENAYINFDVSKSFTANRRFAVPLKFALGMLGVIVLYLPVGAAEKYMTDFSFVLKNIKNAVVFVWICCVYPIIINKFAKYRV